MNCRSTLAVISEGERGGGGGGCASRCHPHSDMITELMKVRKKIREQQRFTIILLDKRLFTL